MPFKPVERPKRPKRDPFSVYEEEERVAGGLMWDKKCSKCENHQKTSDSEIEKVTELDCEICAARKCTSGIACVDTGDQQNKKKRELIATRHPGELAGRRHPFDS